METTAAETRTRALMATVFRGGVLRLEGAPEAWGGHLNVVEREPGVLVVSTTWNVRQWGVVTGEEPTERLEVPVVEDLEAKILERAEEGCLYMETWHTCATTHCLAGWAVVLGGPAALALEQRFGSATAGALVYLVSEGYVPDFFQCRDEVALKDLRERVALRRAGVVKSWRDVPL